MLQPYQSRQLFNAQNYEELCRLWSKDEDQTTVNVWDYCFLIRAFNKLERYSESLETYKLLHERFPNSHIADFFVTWAIYYIVKSFNPKEQNPQIIASSIDILKTLERGEKTAHNKAILEACDQLASSRPLVPGTQNNWQTILDYLSLIPDNELSQESYEIKEDNKTIHCPTEQEKWYNLMSKSLNELKRYQDCVDCIDTALQVIPHFHSNIDLWLKNRKAYSLIQLNQLDEAENLLISIKSRLKHWKIEQTLFDLDLQRNCINSARQHAAKCALFDNIHKSRINFYRKYAKFTESLGLAEETQYLWRFIQILRQENDWTMRTDEQNRPIAPEIMELNRKQVLSRLKQFWETEIPQKERMTGTMKISLNDFSGLITPDNNPQIVYYFSINSIIGERKLPKPGQRVSFTLEDRYNKKRNETKPCAVEIRLIGE